MGIIPSREWESAFSDIDSTRTHCLCGQGHHTCMSTDAYIYTRTCIDIPGVQHASECIVKCTHRNVHCKLLCQISLLSCYCDKYFESEIFFSYIVFTFICYSGESSYACNIVKLPIKFKMVKCLCTCLTHCNYHNRLTFPEFDTFSCTHHVLHVLTQLTSSQIAQELCDTETFQKA
jgi:hypothetical protein